jgi:hypothetical protein
MLQTVGGRQNVEAMPEMRSWDTMREQIHPQLERQTGQGVDAWRTRIGGQAGPASRDEAGLRAWLSEQGVTG